MSAPETLSSKATARSDIATGKPAHLIQAIPIIVVIGVYLWLAMYGALNDPMFTKPDEPYHFAYLTHLAEGGGLPAVDLAKPKDQHAPSEMEAHQPPLYYLTAWVASLPFPAPAEGFAARNTHFQSTDIGNRNGWTPSRVPNPFDGPLAAFMVGRLISVAFGALAVICGYVVLSSLLGNTIAAAATGLLAFNAQFIYISSSFSNDTAETGTAAVTLLLLLRLYRRPSSRALAVGSGLAMGAAVLAKLSGLGLIAVLVLLALSSMRQATWRALAPWGLATVVAGVVAGWWFWRNQELYGNALGLNVLPALLGRRSAPPTADDWSTFFGFVWKSYWFDLGNGGVNFVDDAVYWAIGVLVALGVMGAALAFIRRRHARIELGVSAVWAVTVLVPTMWTGNQWAVIMGGGRLLYPAATGATILLGVGLAEIGRRFRVDLTAIAAPSFLALAIWGQFLYLQGSNPSPKFLRSAEDVSPTHRVEARFGPAIRLIGYDVDIRGNEATVRYLWTAEERPPADYSVFLEQLIQNPNGRSTSGSEVITFPGYGATRTGIWERGTVLMDELRLKLRPVPRGSRLLLVTGLYDAQTTQRLQVDVRGTTRPLPSGDGLVLAEEPPGP